MRSSLPFAIGQIQDVGLIFLGAMSTGIVNSLESWGEMRDSTLLATTLLAITLSTACVGALLIVVGKCVEGWGRVGQALVRVVVAARAARDELQHVMAETRAAPCADATIRAGASWRASSPTCRCRWWRAT